MKLTLTSALIILSILTATVIADYGYDDSQEFELNLLSFPTGGQYGYDDSGSFNLNAYPVNRGWDDSVEFTLDTGGSYESSDVEVSAGVKYNDNTEELYITAYARNRATNQDMSSETASYEILDIGMSGTFDSAPGDRWMTTVDLSGHTLAAGRHPVKVTIGDGSSTQYFTVIADSGTIAGVVLDTDKQPLGSCNVQLFKSNDYHNGGSSIRSTSTNGFGQYTLSNIYPGIYIVSVQKSGYLNEHSQATITVDSGDIVDFTLAQTQGGGSNMTSLIQPMQKLKNKVLDAMEYETELMSEMSSGAEEYLSIDFSFTDIVSVYNSIISPRADKILSAGTIPVTESRIIVQDIIMALAKFASEKTYDLAIQIYIENAIEQLLPNENNDNNWAESTVSQLENLDYYKSIVSNIESIESEFETGMKSSTMRSDFDQDKAEQAISSMKKQLETVIDGESVSYLLYHQSTDKYYYDLVLPTGKLAWMNNVVALASLGRVNDVSTWVEAVSGTAVLVLSPTAVGSGFAGAVYGVSKATSSISGWIQIPAKSAAALTYTNNAYGWLIDLNNYNHYYNSTTQLMESEVKNPYYLSAENDFTGGLSVNMNLVPNLGPFVGDWFPIRHNTATVTLTNTSNNKADFYVMARSWQDYKRIPGLRATLNLILAGATNSRIPCANSVPQKFTLSENETETIDMAYIGYKTNSSTIYKNNWLKIDLYAGPFHVDSESKPYHTYQMPSPLMLAPKQDYSSTEVYASFEEDGLSESMDEINYADFAPTVTELTNTTLDAESNSYEVLHTVPEDVYDIEFKLIADDAEKIVLQVYDADDHCVGFDHNRGGVLTEFAASYYGTGAGYQQVVIPNSSGRTYRVKVILQGSENLGPFKIQLFAFESPLRPAMMAASAESIQRATPWDNAFDLTLSVGEGGQQNPIEGVTVTLSELSNADGSESITVYTATSIDIGTIPAESSEAVSFEMSAPYLLPSGEYKGQIDITSANAGAITIPVTITVDDAREDLNKDGAVTFEDFTILASLWMQTCSEPDWCDSIDLNESQRIDEYELARIAEMWLWRAEWNKE